MNIPHCHMHCIFNEVLNTICCIDSYRLQAFAEVFSYLLREQQCQLASHLVSTSVWLLTWWLGFNVSLFVLYKIMPYENALHLLKMLQMYCTYRESMNIRYYGIYKHGRYIVHLDLVTNCVCYIELL